TGTEVYDQIKDRIIHQPEDVEYGYWHQTEMWRHDRYSFEELQAARDQLIDKHREACTGIASKVQRKWERLAAVVKHPQLIGDWFEIRSRKKQYRKRIDRWMKDGRFDHGNIPAPASASRVREAVAAD
ncbi:MAG: hypothetical protein ACF8XB_14350, partial [Planctomycetota bacterium JB042]